VYVYEWEAKSSLASSLFPGAHVFGTYTVSPWRIHLFKVEGASSALRNYSCWFNIPDLSPHQVNKQCMLHGFYLLVTVAPPSVVVIPKGKKLKSFNALTSRLTVKTQCLPEQQSARPMPRLHSPSSRRPSSAMAWSTVPAVLASTQSRRP